MQWFSLEKFLNQLFTLLNLYPRFNCICSMKWGVSFISVLLGIMHVVLSCSQGYKNGSINIYHFEALGQLSTSCPLLLFKFSRFRQWLYIFRFYTCEHLITLNYLFSLTICCQVLPSFLNSSANSSLILATNPGPL